MGAQVAALSMGVQKKGCEPALSFLRYKRAHCVYDHANGPFENPLRAHLCRCRSSTTCQADVRFRGVEMWHIDYVYLRLLQYKIMA